ncbi:MAG: N-(5'-phosphoribosyl)anthranilate isomerase [Roseovarius sp.]|nr:N-(5'-phosphoribosyl)anthranilate isomerase [Roseovarius sp.]
MTHHGPITAAQWMGKLFSSRAAREGRVIRRQLRDIERFVGRARFEAELARRGYHAVENAGQLVIFCNEEPIRVVL